MRISQILFILAIVTLAFGTVIPHLGKAHRYPPKVHSLQLNDEPYKRWQSIVADYKLQFHKLAGILDTLFDFAPFLKWFGRPLDFFSKIYKYREFVEEIQGIADAADLPFDTIFFLNYAYEVSTISGHACSGILVRNANNTVIHGRNLDFEFWGTFAELFSRVNWYRGEELVFSSDQVIGSVFVLTGMKNGKFAVHVDTRITHDYFKVFSSIFVKQVMPSAYLVRKVLEEENSFSDAISRLSSTEITAPIYYVVSGPGPNDGAVIERTFDGVHNMRQLNETTWFIVQTNYDYGEKEPWFDRREGPAEKRIQEIGQQNFNYDSMINDILAKWPTFNIATLESAVISTQNNYFSTVIWYNSTWY